MKIEFKPKGIKQTVTVEVTEVKYICSKYTTVLGNRKMKSFEFAVICDGVVKYLFIATPSQFADFTKLILNKAIRASYGVHGRKPTWEEVDAFTDEVIELI